jgi:hypothetical protein
MTIRGLDQNTPRSEALHVDAKEQEAVSAEIIRFLYRRGVFDADTILMIGMTLITWGLSVAQRDQGAAVVQRRRAATAECVRRVELIDV